MLVVTEEPPSTLQSYGCHEFFIPRCEMRAHIQTHLLTVAYRISIPPPQPERQQIDGLYYKWLDGLDAGTRTHEHVRRQQQQ